MKPEEVLDGDRAFAVVGASNDRSKYGNIIFRALRDAKFRAFPVNPRREMIEGQPCFPSVESLPVRPDVAIMVVPPGVTAGAIESCARAGKPFVWMQPGSWDEAAIRLCRELGLEHAEDVCILVSLKLRKKKK